MLPLLVDTIFSMNNCGEREPASSWSPLPRMEFLSTEAGLGREEVDHGSSMI